MLAAVLFEKIQKQVPLPVFNTDGFPVGWKLARPRRLTETASAPRHALFQSASAGAGGSRRRGAWRGGLALSPQMSSMKR